MVCRIPIWYTVKVVFVAWLVLPQFKGAAFLYETYVRQQLKRYIGRMGKDHLKHEGKNKEEFRVDRIRWREKSNQWIGSLDRGRRQRYHEFQKISSVGFLELIHAVGYLAG
ncbi:hypothetical protein ACLOJK_002095 [Asimina triloba]